VCSSALLSRLRSIAALLMFLLLAPPAQAQENLVRNPSFSEGSAPWWGEPPSIKISRFDALSAAEVTGGFIVQEKIAVVGGKRYRLSMKIAAKDAPDNSIFVQISARGAGVNPGWFGPATIITQGHPEAAGIITGGTHGWVSFSTVFEAPKGADQLLIYLRKEYNSAGRAFFSDVTLVETKDLAIRADDGLKQNLIANRFLAGSPAKAPVPGAGGQNGPHEIIAHGQLAMSVYAGKSEDYITLSAAVALADMLAKIAETPATGKVPTPLLSSDDNSLPLPHLVIGGLNAITRAHINRGEIESLSDDGFIIRSIGQNIIITGRTSRGTMYGVNWFLDRKLGVRWLSPTVTHVPSSPELTVTALNERQNPRFSFREILISEAQDKVWRQHNLLNGESHGPAYQPTPPAIASWDRSWQIPGSGDPFFSLLPPETFAKDHPDWYAGGQLAMMNKGMRAAMAAAVIARMRQLPDYRSVWYAINDQDWGWDMDPQSRAFADQHGGTASAPRLDMMIDVAQQVRAVLPDAKLAFNAYHWSFKPPEGMVVPDFLLVYPMTIQVDYSQALSEPANKNIRDGLTQWNAIARHILVWDHITNFSGFIQPTPNILPIARSIKWLSSLDHVQGYFAEGAWDSPGSEFSALRAWLIARLLWNPQEDVDQLIHEFCRDYYGPAGKTIETYIAMYHAKLMASGDRLPEKTQVDLAMFDPAFVLEANRLFDTAQREANATEYAQRVREARIGIDYVTLIRRSEYRAIAAQVGIASPAQVKARTNGLLAAMKEAKVTQFYQGGPLTALVERLAIERKPASAPDFTEKSSMRWHDIQDLSFNLYDNAHIVADAGASDGAAVVLDGRNAGWNVQLKLDKLPKSGKWWVYASVRSEGDGGRGPVAHLGSAPPMSCFSAIDGSSAQGASYHWFEVPGGAHQYSTDHDKSLYVAAVPGPGKHQIYVDRLVVTDRPVRLNATANAASAGSCPS
jgi:hypothetical protein